MRDSNDSTGTQQFDSVLDVNNGRWQHVAVTWGPQDADARMILNGIPVPTSFPYATRTNTGGATFTPWQFPMTIGARDDRGTIIAHFQGCIDERAHLRPRTGKRRPGGIGRDAAGEAGNHG